MPENIERLRRFDSGGHPVLSLYMGLEADPREARTVSARLKDLLDPIHRIAATMERPAQTSLRADVARVMSLESSITDLLGRSVAIFVCGAADFFELIALQASIRDVANVGRWPYLRPLEAALADAARTCAVLVDRRNARIYELSPDGARELERVSDEGTRRDNYAGRFGLQEHGVRNHAEEVAQRQYRDVAAALRALDSRHRFDLIVIGGRSGIADEFMPFVPDSVRDRLAGTFVIDPRTATPAQVAARCAPLVTEHRLVHQHRVAKEVLSAAHRFDTALGLRATLEAANSNAIELLILDRTVSVMGVSCPNCGWLGLSGGRCPSCDSRLETHSDVLDELARRTVANGGVVEQIATVDDLPEDGVAAKLRFELPVG